MELIAELLELIVEIKESTEYCEIDKNSQILWTGHTIGNTVFFSAVIDIYRIQEVRIRIEKDRIMLNGFISNEKAVKNHLKDLLDSLRIIEETM